MSDDILNASAQSRLRSIVERIERLEEDKAAVANDIKEVFGEAKGEGYDVKILRKVVRLRKQDKAKRQEEEALLDLYMSAIEGTGGFREVRPLAEADETRITIEFPGAPPIHTTASILDTALDRQRRSAKASKPRGVGGVVQWRDGQPAPDTDGDAGVYRPGRGRARR